MPSPAARPLAALALLAACRRSAPPPASDSPPPASASSPALAAQGPALAPITTLGPAQWTLLWGRSRERSSGDTVTFFISADGSLLGQRPGAHLAHGGRLWKLSTSARSSAGERCPGGSQPFPLRTLHRTALAPADGDGPEIELLPFATDDPAPAEQLHALVGGLGPFLFVSSQTVSAPCGEVPPRYRASFFAWELRDRPVAVPLDELRAGSEASLDQALALLNQGAPRGLAPGDPDAPAGAAQVTLVSPALSPEGLGWVAQYTAPASWARSRGGWGSHTRSERIRLPSFPPRLAPHAGLPEPALRFLRQQAGLDFIGVSAGPISR